MALAFPSSLVKVYTCGFCLILSLFWWSTMADANVNLSNLFADLKKIEQNGEYERGLKITDKSKSI